MGVGIRLQHGIGLCAETEDECGGDDDGSWVGGDEFGPATLGAVVGELHADESGGATDVLAREWS